MLDTRPKNPPRPAFHCPSGRCSRSRRRCQGSADDLAADARATGAASHDSHHARHDRRVDDPLRPRDENVTQDGPEPHRSDGKGGATCLDTPIALLRPLGLIPCAIWLATALVTRISSLSALMAAALSQLIARGRLPRRSDAGRPVHGRADRPAAPPEHRPASGRNRAAHRPQGLGPQRSATSLRPLGRSGRAGASGAASCRRLSEKT